MDQPPLPKLLPGDPQNRLSAEARQRIQPAYLKSAAIRAEADVEIEHRNIDQDGTLAQSLRKRARLKAAKYILGIMNREYSQANLSLYEFRDCMREEVEGVTNSLELTISERDLLRLEFAYNPLPESPKRSPRDSIQTPTYERSWMLEKLKASAIAGQIPEENVKIAPTSSVYPANADVADSTAEERKALLLAFKRRGRTQRIPITDEMVAQAANPGKWNDRTMVTWWKRNDARITSIHDKKIRAVLVKNPSDLWPSKQ
jgi:hypothetical protein